MNDSVRGISRAFGDTARYLSPMVSSTRSQALTVQGRLTVNTRHGMSNSGYAIG